MTHAHECDVLVIGAGPAGASTALNLLNHTNLSVTLVESSDLQRLRIGESVSSSIFSLLDFLKIPKSHFSGNCFTPTQGNSAFWGSKDSANRHAIFSPDRATFQIDREEFDITHLENVIDRGGQLFPRTKCKKIVRTSDGRHHARLVHREKGHFDVVCRYLVDASGRNSSIARQLGASITQHDRLTGVGAFFKSSSASLEQLQIIESDSCGWWYSASLSKHLLVVSFFSDFELISNMKLNRTTVWHNYLNKTHHMANRIEGLEPIENNLWIRPAGTHFNHFSRISNYLPVGDAACSFDPISSMGLGFAMASGCQAAAIIGNSKTPNMFIKSAHQYQNDLKNQFQHYLTLKEQFYNKEQRWQDASFWQKRQKKMDSPIYQ